MPPSFFERLDKYRLLLNEKAVADFMPILEQGKNLTTFYSDSIFWRYRSSIVNHELSMSEHKVRYAIDNDIYSFILTVDEQKQVMKGKSLKHVITQKN